MECSGDQNSVHSIHDLYYRHMKCISKADLKFVEKDLAFYEKVSLSFLLFGENKSNAQYILQRLLVLLNNRNDESDILYSFSKSTDNWQQSLIEALAIIGANKILRKLGFSISDLRTIFLPHVPEVSVYIHAVLKALFILCERLDSAEAGRLVLGVNTEKTTNFIRFYERHMLEVYFLDWLTKDIIKIGTTPSTTNLDLITRFLKDEGKDNLKEMLNNVFSNLNNSNKSQSNVQPEINHNEHDNSVPKSENFQRVDYDDRYTIRKNWAGFIVIFNQKNFFRDPNPDLQVQLPDEALKERRGTDVDSNKLKTTFASFGFKPIVFNDCSDIEMKNKIADFVKRSEVYDSLIICILSHGIKDAVYGNNSIPVQIETIRHIMAAKSLLRKPKMLIIQACQKGESVIKNHETTLDGPHAVHYGDMITAVATIPGFVSIRNIETGTFFIQTLCDLVNQLGDRKHMLDILTAVNSEVRKKEGIGKQRMVPQTQTTLNKSLFLPKRH